MAGTPPPLKRRHAGPCAVGLLALAACAGRLAPQALPAPPAQPALDASYDWHVLLPAPFGTRLKETPVPLHEVLLFHDSSTPVETGPKDCYGTHEAPRFLGRPTQQYLLCFDQDRLERVEAAVDLDADAAGEILGRSCLLWHGTLSDAPDAPGCAGRDGAVRFSAGLAVTPGESQTALSVTLSAASP